LLRHSESNAKEYVYRNCVVLSSYRSLDSAVGVATGYGLDERRVGIQVPAEISFLHVVQADSGAHPASYPMGTGGLSQGHEADHSPPSSAEVKKAWIYTFTPLYVFRP
jgi:hypothetical protein